MSDATFLIKGELGFNSILDWCPKGLAFIEENHNPLFDFSGVTETDSAGLACLIQWLRHADDYSKKITLHALPEQLLSVAKVCHVEGILGEYQEK